MAIIRQDFDELEGKNEYYCDLGAIITATDSNPVVIEGDFADKTIYVYGSYMYSGSGSSQAISTLTKSEGVMQTVYTGASTQNNFKGYRHITYYPNRIEIGQGGYGASGLEYNNSQYGSMLIGIV